MNVDLEGFVVPDENLLAYNMGLDFESPEGNPFDRYKDHNNWWYWNTGFFDAYKISLKENV
jgi:hypothetical protein